MTTRRGHIVAVDFSDHVEGGSKPIRFVVYGRVACITRSAVVVDSWEYRDLKHPHDRNETRYTIVRSAIHKITRLVAAKEA